MSINGTLYAPHTSRSNCYLQFILPNKPMLTMGLRQNWIYSVKSCLPLPLHVPYRLRSVPTERLRLGLRQNLAKRHNMPTQQF